MLDEDLKTTGYFWYGRKCGKRLVGLSRFPASKKSRRDKEGKRHPRPNHVDIPLSKFEHIETLTVLVSKLFA